MLASVHFCAHYVVAASVHLIFRLTRSGYGYGQKAVLILALVLSLVGVLPRYLVQPWPLWAVKAELYLSLIGQAVALATIFIKSFYGRATIWYILMTMWLLYLLIMTPLLIIFGSYLFIVGN